MPINQYTVFIVEDDPSVRDALGLLLGINGHAVALFADAESFLRAYRPDWLGCLLIDIRMPGPGLPIRHSPSTWVIWKLWVKSGS